MSHLTKKEILEFLSLSDVDETQIKLAKHVNAHLMVCKQCRDKVAALQDLLTEKEEEVRDPGNMYMRNRVR